MSRNLAILGSRGIPAKYGGFETFAEQIARRLAAHGIAVTVYCEADAGDQPAEFQGVNLLYVNAPNAGPFSTIIFDAICLWKARKSFDVVYMLGYGASPLCFLPRIWGTVVWINMDGIEWMRSKWSFPARLYLRFCEMIAMRTANRVIADAQEIRTHLFARHSAKPSCSVIPYGAAVIDNAPDESLIRDYAVNAHGYYLIVCRLEPENHIQEALLGFQSSGSPFPLLVFGDQSIDNDYVRSLRVMESERIRFVGTLFDQAKLQAMRWYCRAYVHGHSVGGTNPSLLEAMGCGNLIIAHDNVFNREVAPPDARFFQVANDLPSIIDAVDGLNIDETSRFGPQERVRQNYSWPQIVDSYIDTLDQDLRATRMS